MIKIIFALFVGIFVQLCLGSEYDSWYTAIVSNVNNDDFYFHSPNWKNGTVFGTNTSDSTNAMFDAYSTIYVKQVMIDMDGTVDGSCTTCAHVFNLPSSHYGKYTLSELVNLDGGVELEHEENYEWRYTQGNYFSFSSSEVSMTDNTYCYNMGINYPNWEGTRHNRSPNINYSHINYSIIYININQLNLPT